MTVSCELVLQTAKADFAPSDSSMRGTKTAEERGKTGRATGKFGEESYGDVWRRVINKKLGRKFKCLPRRKYGKVLN